jgi:RNA polymerase primary sigma factor
MYLREMASMELLSREGEIAIAKRIEAGREAMFAGLCESPLTFQAIVIWRDELNEGRVLLREIVDLDATYVGPEAKAPPTPEIDPKGEMIASIAVPGQPARPPQMLMANTVPLTPLSHSSQPAKAATVTRRQPTCRSARATTPMTTTTRRAGSRSPRSRRSSSPR